MTATPDAPSVDAGGAAGPSDAELLAAVRGGDDDAFGTLWARHEGAARRLARQITRPSETDDLVSESFYRVLRAIKSGGGPDAAFRPYLLSTMRRFNIDTGRSYHQRVLLTEDDDELDVEHSASAAAVFETSDENRAAWQAWESLPDASRTLLWHLIIEEETPAQIAPLLGTSPNGVASRAVRAKERLRQAFLAQHLAAADEDACREARAKFGGYVRNALSARDRAAVDSHVDGCARCRAALAEITDTNATLRGVVAPIILGGGVVAGKYLAAAHVAAGAAHGAGAVFVAKRVIKQAAQRAATTPGAVAAGVVAVALVATIAAVATAAINHHHNTSASRTQQVSGVNPSGGSAGQPPAGTQPASKSKSTPKSGSKSGSSSSPSTPPASTPTQPSQSTQPSSPSAGTKSGGSSPRPHPSTKPTSKPTKPKPPPQRTDVVTFTVTSSLGEQLQLSVPSGWQITQVIGPAGIALDGTPTLSDVWFISTTGTVTVRVTGASASRAFLSVYTTNGDGSGDYPLN